MAAKQKTKSRTSKSKLNKKAHFPRWVIAVVALLIACVSIALVYNSFASAGNTEQSIIRRNIYCMSGRCYDEPVVGTVTILGFVTNNVSYIPRNCESRRAWTLNVSTKNTNWQCLYFVD